MKRGGKRTVHFSGDVFGMDAKEEPTWKYLRRAPGKLYGVIGRRMLQT